MAGLGSRFAKAGFTTPKPLIEVDAMPMFQKALQSLSDITATKTFYFVIRQEHVETQQLDRLIRQALPTANVIVIPEMTRGAVETAYAAKDHLLQDDALLIMDCDLWFQSSSYNTMVEQSLIGKNTVAGGLLTFPANNPRYSYAKFGSDMLVTETAEKRVISEHAITGAYFFATAAGFVTAAEKLLERSLSEKMPEYYLSLLYNILIDEGKQIQATIVDEYASFGTPEELEAYLKTTARSR